MEGDTDTPSTTHTLSPQALYEIELLTCQIPCSPKYRPSKIPARALLNFPNSHPPAQPQLLRRKPRDQRRLNKVWKAKGGSCLGTSGHICAAGTNRKEY